MELIVLRMATMFGANDPGNVGRLMQTIDRGRFLWIGGGQNYKSLVHVDDAATACVLAATLDHSAQHGTFNVTAEPCSMHAIVTELSRALGRRPPSLQIPARVPLTAAAVASRIPGLVSRATRFRSTIEKWLSDEIFDATSFRAAFGWDPAVPLETGIARQVNQYRAAFKLNRHVRQDRREAKAA